MTKTPMAIDRRSLLQATAAAVLLSGCSGTGSGAKPATASAAADDKTGHAEGSESVTFPSGPATISGNLYHPPGFDESRTYPAIVVSHPWGGVKEQTAGLYARSMAEQGFITLAYDAAHYGESEGRPRNMEDPAHRVRDIRSAVTYLSNHRHVDADRIGTLGVCAGGGYTIDEAQTDLRVRAVATVAAYDMGAAAREGIDGAPVSYEQRMAQLEEIGEQLTREAGGDPLVEQLVPGPDQQTDDTPSFFREAADYYLTDRGGHPRAENRYVVTSVGLHMAYFPFAQIETISPRPLLLIAGENAETLRFSRTAYKAAKEPKELMTVPGASHFDLYDRPQYVEPAVERMAEFFAEHLA
ncbi:alpha/beta hydrolase [Nocardiopsis sp. RSe5-2]|uniref:Alpha/beta hydrolase n=1 Tax=Nocardiopsis endophytica TaxID=3018445 RepID=A0ABT4U0Q9_9ACTN|nr:alpha/beta hydrolase [Nocardiopsis endophytica]MDA2809952.1 alpha/beta hydrolase [Nocardiopsis endophytica]